MKTYVTPNILNDPWIHRSIRLSCTSWNSPGFSSELRIKYKPFSGEKQRPFSCTEEFKLQTYTMYHLQGHNPTQEVGLGSLMLKSPDYECDPARMQSVVDAGEGTRSVRTHPAAFPAKPLRRKMSSHAWTHQLHLLTVRGITLTPFSHSLISHLYSEKTYILIHLCLRINISRLWGWILGP